MKPLQIAVYAFTLGLLTALHAAAPTPEVQQLLNEGQAAYMKGDMDGAKAAFEMVYSMDSRNVTAINFLTRMKAEKGAKVKVVPLERQVAAVVIPQIQFRDATLSSALEYMKKAVSRESGGKVAVNFVVQLPADQVNTQTVTLALSNVPFSEALKYLGTVASLDFIYDKYAIIVRSKTDSAATAATTSAPPAAPAPAQ